MMYNSGLIVVLMSQGECRNILCHAWEVSDEVNVMCGTCRQYVDAIYLSEQPSILGWLFVTTLYCNLSLLYRLNVFQRLDYLHLYKLQ
jgi:hypothetical protein